MRGPSLTCRQIGFAAAAVASRTPLHASGAAGGFQRSLPTGGAANGTLRHWREARPVSSHSSAPSDVCTRRVLLATTSDVCTRRVLLVVVLGVCAGADNSEGVGAAAMDVACRMAASGNASELNDVRSERGIPTSLTPARKGL